MKASFVVSIFCCGAVAAGTVLYLARNKTRPTSTPVIESSPEEVTPAPQPQNTVLAAAPPATPSVAREPATRLAEPPSRVEQPPPEKPNATVVSRAIETLVSGQASWVERQAVWKQLQEAGQLDEVIEALKKGAASNPDSAQYPAALGQANLQKAAMVSRSGGSINEMGILGMQADQSFDTALKLDPSNWDAQFFKAVAMAHWPAELNKGEEVIQRLSHLIDQQEAQTPKPEFVNPYVLLGDQYQKMGRPDYAKETWRLGLGKFPGDPNLQNKVRGQ